MGPGVRRRNAAAEVVWLGQFPAPEADPMSEDARLGMLDKLRYLVIDVLDSKRGRRVATLVFLAAWGALAAWFLLWGVLLGWIPAAVMAISIGYVCR